MLHDPGGDDCCKEPAVVCDDCCKETAVVCDDCCKKIAETEVEADTEVKIDVKGIGRTDVKDGEKTGKKGEERVTNEVKNEEKTGKKDEQRVTNDTTSPATGVIIFAIYFYFQSQSGA